jgi:DHA2 family multidrug resistance protein
VWSVLGGRESVRVRQPIDAVGLLLLAVGVGSLQIMLDKGNELDWFGSNLIVALACTAAVALATLVAWVLTAAHPIVDLRLFARRNYAVGVAAFGLASVAFFGVNVVVPLWLQTEMGYTSEWAGRTMAFGGMLAVVLGPLIGANIHRVDARFVAAFGLAVFAVFAFLSASFPPDVDFWTLALTRLIMGVGLSSLFLPLITIYLSGLPPERVPSAAGLANFTRNIGSSFGTSVMVSLWDHRTTQFGAALAEHVANHNPAATDYLGLLASAGLSREAALAYIRDAVIAPQASFLATNAVLTISGTMMLALIALVMLARPPFDAPQAGARR